MTRFAAISAIILFALSAFAPGRAFAAGGCPKSADNLQEFARCMVPTQGGMRYAGTAYDLDEHHQQLLSAMSQTTGVPPQVWNGTSGIINPGWGGVIAPIIGTTAYVYGRGGNPWLWNWWAMQMMTPQY